MPKSEAKAKADAKYNKKAYQVIPFTIRRDAELNKDAIKAYASSRGESINGFILRAVMETIEREQADA